MTKKTRKIAVLGVAIVLVGVLAAPALAHNWGCWVMNNKTMTTRNTATYWSEANAALQEWENDTIITVPRVSSHTETSVYDGNYGNTGWGGLASIESASGCTINHCHSRLNYYYSYSSNGKRGIFCQEFGHCMGLDHSNDGGCMGGGYWYDINTNYTVVSHNINDIYNKYINKSAAKHDEHGEDPGDGGGRPLVHAVWWSQPETLVEARKLSSAIVVARVEAISANADIVVSITAGEEDRIPNQNVRLQVQRVLFGEAADSIDLFHTGNDEYVLAGDPAYKVGQRYVLFITPREDGTFRVISPEGRYMVGKTGLVPMSEKSFSKFLSGARVGDLVRDLREIEELAAQ